MKVGFIGLGRMGTAMANRVLGGGHDLIVYNRTAEKAKALKDAGAMVAGSIAEACAGREVVITMLAHDAALVEVSTAPGGLLESLPGNAIHLAMGTHGTDALRAMTKAHLDAGRILVAAPVLGRPEVAAQGQVGIVPAGPADAIARCQPLFEVIGRRTFDAGPEPEMAAVIKLANNFVLGCAMNVLGEAYALVRKYGIDANLMHEVLTDGMFNCVAYKVYGEIIAQQDYDRVGITATLGLKDANLVMAAADFARVPLPSGNAWRDRLLDAIAHDDGEKDWAVVGRAQARASGLDG